MGDYNFLALESEKQFAISIQKAKLVSERCSRRVFKARKTILRAESYFIDIISQIWSYSKSQV